MSPQLWALLSLLISVAGGWLVARQAAKAQEKKTLADADVSSGQLALSIAKDSDAKSDKLEAKIRRWEAWGRQALRWADKDEAWHLRVENELERLDPGSTVRVPPRDAFPEPPDGDH